MSTPGPDHELSEGTIVYTTTVTRTTTTHGDRTWTQEHQETEHQAGNELHVLEGSEEQTPSSDEARILTRVINQSRGNTYGLSTEQDWGHEGIAQDGSDLFRGQEASEFFNAGGPRSSLSGHVTNYTSNIHNHDADRFFDAPEGTTVSRVQHISVPSHTLDTRHDLHTRSIYHFTDSQDANTSSNAHGASGLPNSQLGSTANVQSTNNAQSMSRSNTQDTSSFFDAQERIGPISGQDTSGAHTAHEASDSSAPRGTALPVTAVGVVGSGTVREADSSSTRKDVSQPTATPEASGTSDLQGPALVTNPGVVTGSSTGPGTDSPSTAKGEKKSSKAGKAKRSRSSIKADEDSAPGGTAGSSTTSATQSLPASREVTAPPLAREVSGFPPVEGGTHSSTARDRDSSANIGTTDTPPVTGTSGHSVTRQENVPLVTGGARSLATAQANIVPFSGKTNNLAVAGRVTGASAAIEANSAPNVQSANEPTKIGKPNHSFENQAVINNSGAGQTNSSSYMQEASDSSDAQETYVSSDTSPLNEKVPRPVKHRQVSEDFFGDADRAELVRVATQLSRRQSLATGAVSRSQTLKAVDEEDPALDPVSDRFDLHKWIRNFAQSLQREGITAKQTGVVFKDVDIFGQGAAVRVQETVGSFFLAPLRIMEFFSFGKKPHKQILHKFDGLIKGGELVIVLGRPGSGCSTLLKTLCGELHGLTVGSNSVIHYDGIPQKQMKKEFKGEAIYNQEVDKHFPHLTVGQTLEYAAAARTPSKRLNGMSRIDFSRYVANVVMAAFGLSHTRHTKVGNDFVRGVSGGERKRVSIAEMALSGSPFACWDNSTRGLDSATAFKFVESLRMACDIGDGANAVAIYQASQAIYDLFDKATVLYEGRQIYFGPANKAKAFFERQGWHCPSRQTTGDFLTSVTNPQERQPRHGMEKQVPRTAEEFERYWRGSHEYRALKEATQVYETGLKQTDKVTELREQKMLRQANHVRPNSPYTISIWMQIKLNTKRAYQRLWNDKSSTLTSCISQIIMALIIGSIFYGNPDASAGFFAKGSVLFMAILINALTAISEINSLYAQRPIVEKHASYAFCHPATEAAAGIVADIPIKFLSAVAFNIVLYFLAGLRREPSQFFIYFLITFITTFVMSAVFRTMAAITKTVSQAMSLSGVLVLALVIYTGFTITVPNMHPWFSWIRWINPIFYGFEILVANEFHGRRFTCSSFVPPYSPFVGNSYICSVAGAVAGQRTVSGDAFIAANYNYYYSHVWRNFGILLAFLFAFMIIYFITTELNSATASTAEALVFQRNHVPAYLRDNHQDSEDVKPSAISEKPDASHGGGNVKAIEPQKDIFTWRDVVYDIRIKNQPRRLLDNVSGWVRPGTLTALMGVSGAGKTTLLDVLAQRTTMGVITGDMLVNGKPRDPSFQRKTGYVQQQDLHLETSTVRESLRFSAMLRQPPSVSKEEKYAFVEEVIKMLDMEEFADAVVGVPGEGLNVRERKLLTIGVELAAKPKLLLFLDEPTSGLDSQSSWAICAFLRKLADAGQAILCTVHQPSAILFQSFDRLLFLAKGGKTVYFGDIGRDSRTLLDYFESHGSRKCGDNENPAEFMLEIVNNGTNNRGEDWHSVWKASQERSRVDQEIEQIHAEKINEPPAGSNEAGATSEFAMPFMTQLREVGHRVFQQYWRMPGYVFAKFFLGVAAGLFIGFSFYDADPSQAGMQTVIFSIFMITTIFSTLVQQIQPLFVTQRSLYEVREKPSKSYSWKAFIIANIIVEIPYQIFTGILIYACWYFPVMGASQSSERQGLVLLFIIQLFIYASSFAQMTIVAMPDAQTAAHIVTLLTLMSITFCGVLQTPDALPGFWIFMYRVSPFTYWVGGIASTELHGRRVECSSTETLRFSPPSGQTCRQYLAPFLAQAPGLLQNPNDTQECRYCPLTVADQFLAGSRIYWSERWRNYGIIWAFIVFNFFMAVLLYYLFRVKKWNLKKK